MTTLFKETIFNIFMSNNTLLKGKSLWFLKFMSGVYEEHFLVTRKLVCGVALNEPSKKCNSSLCKRTKIRCV